LQSFIGFVVAITVAINLSQGMFGMNLLDLSVYLNFWSVVSTAIVMSITTLLIFILIPHIKKTSQEIQLKQFMAEVRKKRKNSAINTSCL